MIASLHGSSDQVNTGVPIDDLDQTSLAAETAQPSPGPTEPPKNRIPEIPVSQVRHVKSQEELDEVLAAHSQWVEQVLDPDVEVAHGRANLSGVDLRGFSLREANLSGANLAKANLAEVDLTAANLSAANLAGAILACANLCGAKLRGAKLEGADLRGADLTGAYLQGVDLSRCTLKSPEPPAAKAEAKAAPEPEQDEPAPQSLATESFADDATTTDSPCLDAHGIEPAEEELSGTTSSESPENVPPTPLFGEQISYIVP